MKKIFIFIFITAVVLFSFHMINKSLEASEKIADKNLEKFRQLENFNY